jgi:hypothetical protein
MTKLTAANSPLLHVVKDETNNRVFKNASKIANIDGEAAVIDYLMVLYLPDAQPAARKRYTALIAGQSKLLDTIRRVVRGQTCSALPRWNMQRTAKPPLSTLFAALVATPKTKVNASA